MESRPPALRLKTFGSPAVERLTGPLGGSAAQRQPLALLALVAAAGGRGLSRDKIIALLWPEADAPRAGHRLSQLLHAVRRSLEEPEVFSGSAEIRLNPDHISSDVADFKTAWAAGQLERAVSCYSGPFLDGFYLGEAPEFERWVESERAALERAYGESLETLAIDAETRAEQAGAARWWRLLADHEPLSSRVIMRLMSALAAHGDRAGALHQARRYEVDVGRELEASPNPAVLALAARLRRAPAGDVPWAGGTPYRFSVAVLPIANLSSAPENDYLAEGLVEELTNRLARLEGVRVAVPQGDSLDRMGFDALLEGSIRQAEGRVRLILRLVDAGDKSCLWSGRYERAVENIFDVQDELTETVLAELGKLLLR